jgi:transposase InsO family protein
MLSPIRISRITGLLLAVLAGLVQQLPAQGFEGILERAKVAMPPRSRYRHTTHSEAPLRFSNHYKALQQQQQQGLCRAQAEQCWVADITYLRVGEGFRHLALVTDAHSRRIMGWQLSRRLKDDLSCYALQAALRQRRYPDRPLIHHSDRGTQYNSNRFAEMLRVNGIEGSMGA